MSKPTVYQRLKILREHEKMGIAEFAKSIGANESNYRKQEKGVLKPDFAHSIIVRACELYKVNANWLLFGEGEMLIEKNNVDSAASVSLSDALQFYEREAKRVDRILAQLDEKDEQLDKKDEQIEALMKDVEQWRNLALKKIQVTA